MDDHGSRRGPSSGAGRRLTRALLAASLLSPAVAFGAEGGAALLPLNTTEGVHQTWGRKGASRSLEVVTGAENSTDGDGALRVAGTSTAGEGSHYFGIMVPLGRPVDLREARLLFDARTNAPKTTRAFYVRCYNRGEKKPAWSFCSWNGPLEKTWRTFSVQRGLSLSGLSWEARVVGSRLAHTADRIEFIIGTKETGAAVDLIVDNLRMAPRVQTLQNLARPKTLVRRTVVVRGGRPAATVLHPDSEAGRRAAEAVVRSVRERTGVSLPARPGAEKDRQPDRTCILIGNVHTNPAMLLLYARYLTPADSVCPGDGGSLVHTVFDPFGKGVNAVVLGASDEAGLGKAAEVFCRLVARHAAKSGPRRRPRHAAGRDLVLPRIFERGYSAGFLKRFGWAGGEPNPKRLEQGLAAGQRALDTGRHTSIAGALRTAARNYQLTGHSVEAKLFVRLWDMYVRSAVADPRKYGGPWGFDSDFPSGQVVPGWDVIEHDPSLSDEERLRVTKAMGRWLSEAVIPSASAARSTRVPHNHQTFPGLGALYAGLYFTQGYDVLEGRQWLAAADAGFRRQAGYFKPYEDCNGYQWLTNGHLMRYALARPDFTVFENGNAQRIISYCIGTMNNLGYQVPYGDTGSWKCWNSELVCLDAFTFATGDPVAAWAGALKREIKRTAELYAFYHFSDGTLPDRFDGVRVWPLEPQYYRTFGAAGRPPLERCFDKISFREAMDRGAAYLLLDGLSNGGHKHLDGNSLPQLTQYGRIWLADNDYFKAPVKYHNSAMVFKDGRSGAIPPYAELVGAGESGRYGYSRTRLRGYAGVDWDRTVVWLKWLKSFVVLDRLVAAESDEYQFRLLWHGVGEAELSAGGMLLGQRGPSMRIQLGPGPELDLVDDPDLGANWKGYPHADTVVRSLSAVAKVRLGRGESYLFSTALHGAPGGPAGAWTLRHLAGTDGVLVSTERGDIAIRLGPIRHGAPEGALSTDAKVVIGDPAGITLLGATEARLGAAELHASGLPRDIDLSMRDGGPGLGRLALRQPVSNLRAAADAPPHPVLWERRPAPEIMVLSGNRGVPGAIDLGVKLRSDPPPAKENVFNPTAPNAVDALLDGKWGNDTLTSVMYEADRTVTLTVDLGAPCRIARVRWMQWWSTASSKNTSYLPEKTTVEASSDAFARDVRALGGLTDAGPHPNFGAPLEYRVDGAGRLARWVRLRLEPRPGSAIYLAQVLVEGVPEGRAAQVAPFRFTRLATGRLGADDPLRDVLAATEEGTLLALDGEGRTRWTVEFPCRVNDVATADLDGDGIDEVIVARHDYHLAVLDHDGKEIWKRKLEFYRRRPHVNLVLTGDLDGDGRPEVIAGGENWRFYAFKADGTELWHYESVHPSRSGAVADLDGDGAAEVICGTHYYWMSTLNPDGTRRWRYNFGPICYDIATGSFDGDRTRGVVYGGGDGCIHYVGHDGKRRLRYDTGDDVRHVAAADLDGDGRDEVLAGSMNHNVYCFGADGRRRWRFDLGSPVSALATVGRGGRQLVVAGSRAGRIVTLDAAGEPVASSDLGAALLDLAAHGGAVLAASADGRLRRLGLQP